MGAVTWTAGNSKQGAQAVLRAWFPAKPGKADGLFHSLSVEIWLCVNGDEESQLQPGGEEVRAFQPFPLPIQTLACRTGSLPPSSHKGMGNPQAGLSLQISRNGTCLETQGMETEESQQGQKHRVRHRVRGACGSQLAIPWDETLKLLSSF